MKEIGLGFNPLFVTEDRSIQWRVPPQPTLVEMGLDELLKYGTFFTSLGKKVSLHLARVPVSEGPSLQDEYIRELRSLIPRDCGLASIGIHLTGALQQGLGAYGFSSRYVPSPRSEQNAVRFVQMVQDTFGTSVWVENANFYSPHPKAILRTWESVERVVSLSDAQLIVDLAHLIVDSRNSSVDPILFVGFIDWKKVVEVHLSGINIGGDGSYHDGHGKSVHCEVWRVLDQLEKLQLLDEVEYLTLEHSDLSWMGRFREFQKDLESLAKRIESSILRYSGLTPSYLNQHEYAQSYHLKLLKKRLPDLEGILSEAGYDLKALYQYWLKRLRERNVRRIVISNRDVIPSQAQFTEELVPGFVHWLNTEVFI